MAEAGAPGASVSAVARRYGIAPRLLFRWKQELAAPQAQLPKSIRVDQGPEFISKDLDLWAWSKGVTLDFSRPGKPTDNAFAESFNGKVRAECIDQNWFLSLDDARSKCEAYRRDYNEQRPHSAIGNKTPMELMKSVGQPSHPAA